MTKGIKVPMTKHHLYFFILFHFFFLQSEKSICGWMSFFFLLYQATYQVFCLGGRMSQ